MGITLGLAIGLGVAGVVIIGLVVAFCKFADNIGKAFTW